MIPDASVTYSTQDDAGQINKPNTEARRRRVVTAVVLAAFSLFYFSAVLLRAAEKYFWYDELVSVYLSRLSVSSLWQMLRAGMDSVPLPFHLVTKAANAIFGEGLIATRLPQIFGFWVFCLCLFRFVNKRVGVLGGLIAMLFPIFTGAFYYAYDARPYGIVLGFCGLALVFWQMSLEEPHRKRWLWCYALSVLGAFLIHSYAITIAFPFAVAELVRGIQNRRLNVQHWLAIILPAIIACPTYIPLLEGFRTNAKGTTLVDLAPPVWPQVREFYSFLLGPCMLIVLIVLALLALRCLHAMRRSTKPASLSTAIPLPEIALALSFVALPVVGMIIARTMHSTFIYRYYLPALVAACILTGFAAAVGKPANRVAFALAAVLVCSAGWQFSALIWHRIHGVPENLSEPSSGFSANSSLSGPLDHYSLLLSEARKHKDQPIAIMWPIDYLYLVTYAPDLVLRMYYVQWSETDWFYRCFKLFRPWSPIKYNLATRDQFLQSAPEFLMYGQDSTAASIISEGLKFESIKLSNGHFLAEARH